MRIQRKCVSMAAAALAMMLTHEVIFASNSSKFDAYAKVAPNAGPPPSITTVDPVHIPLTGRTYADPLGFIGDVREERQFLPCNEGHTTCVGNLLPQVVAFASAHPGHFYVLGDEYTGYCTNATQHLPPPGSPGPGPYCTLISPQFYADWYHQFTSAVLAVDPYARFAPTIGRRW